MTDTIHTTIGEATVTRDGLRETHHYGDGIVICPDESQPTAAQIRQRLPLMRKVAEDKTRVADEAWLAMSEWSLEEAQKCERLRKEAEADWRKVRRYEAALRNNSTAEKSS